LGCSFSAEAELGLIVHFIDKFVAEASGVIEMSMADTDLVMHSQLQECAVGFYSRHNFMEVLALGRTVHTVEIFNGWGNWNALQLPLLEMIACRQLVYSSDTEDRNLGTLPHCHWYGHDDISFQDLPVFTKFGAGRYKYIPTGNILQRIKSVTHSSRLRELAEYHDELVRVASMIEEEDMR